MLLIIFCVKNPIGYSKGSLRFVLLTPTIKAWVIVDTCAVLALVGGIKVVRNSQPKPTHRFSQNFQDMFTPRGSRAD